MVKKRDHGLVVSFTVENVKANIYPMILYCDSENYRTAKQWQASLRVIAKHYGTSIYNILGIDCYSDVLEGNIGKLFVTMEGYDSFEVWKFDEVEGIPKLLRTAIKS